MGLVADVAAVAASCARTSMCRCGERATRRPLRSPCDTSSPTKRTEPASNPPPRRKPTLSSPSGALPSDRSPVTHLCRSLCLISYPSPSPPRNHPHSGARCFSTCRTLAPSARRRGSERVGFRRWSWQPSRYTHIFRNLLSPSLPFVPRDTSSRAVVASEGTNCRERLSLLRRLIASVLGSIIRYVPISAALPVLFTRLASGILLLFMGLERWQSGSCLLLPFCATGESSTWYSACFRIDRNGEERLDR